MLFIPLIVLLVCAFIGAGMAGSRNRSALGWGIICFFTGIVGIILLAIVGNAGNQVIIAGGAPHPDEFDRLKWSTLKDADPEIAAAAAKAASLGKRYENELAKRYMTLMDKNYLGGILASVLAMDLSTPQNGTLGKSVFQAKDDGGFMVVKGPHVGKHFASYDDMRRKLGA